MLIAAAVAVALPLTASFEGMRTHPYRDPAPKHTMTVCYGETQVAMHVYSAGQCGDMLRAALAKRYAPVILQCVPALAKSKYLFGASLDASYNAGAGGFCRSPMAARFNAGDLIGGCNAFRGWHVAPGGKLLAGLVRRRETERALCLKDAG
jgi:lysozyme